MASYKESQANRPQSQSRFSMSSAPSHNLPIRHTSSRHHAHSVSLGAVNPSHRVTRRKSMTSTAVNNAAVIAAAINGADEKTHGASVLSNRRSLTLRDNGDVRGNEPAMADHSIGSMDDSRHAEDQVGGHTFSRDESAIDDVLVAEESNGSNSKARARRASEGAYLSKVEGKRASGELRCEKCGKGYKHSSCLTKHLWEHTPEWSYTSKLLISKHQQVQLLEAASVLIGMNQDPSDPPDSARITDSDHSSASPAASGSSELPDEDISSAETTPPPPGENAYRGGSFSHSRAKRHSGNSSVFSRSYQSAPSNSFVPGSMPLESTSFGQHRPGSRRPSTSGVTSSNYRMLDEDEAGLSAAVESLCSFGTPRSGPVHLPLDVPPVPPLPARFAEQNAKRLSGNSLNHMLEPDLGLPPPLTHRLSNERDIGQDRSGFPKAHDDDFYDQHAVSHSRSDEDDDGVFGRMEE